MNASDNVYSYAPQPKAKTARYKGEPPSEEATRKYPGPQTVETQANPMALAAEPTTLIEPRKPHWRDKLAVRRVTEADLDELLAWGLPRVQEIYPRCSLGTVMPMLKLAVTGGKMAFFRTDDACGLFLAESTPWEPELNVYCVFVVGRHVQDETTDGKIRPKSIAHGMQPLAIYEAGLRWAQDIGAVSFMYGPESGYDISPIAEKIGYDRRTTGYVKLLK